MRVRIRVYTSTGEPVHLGRLALPEPDAERVHELEPGPVLQRRWSLSLPFDDGRVVIVDLDGLDVIEERMSEASAAEGLRARTERCK